MTSDELHEILRQVWNREISADEAFGELEPVIYDAKRLRHIINREEGRVHQYRIALNDLLKEAETFEEQNKHLARECREARELLEYDE